MLPLVMAVLILGGAQDASLSLDQLLAKADERAVALAEAQGRNALPALSRMATHPDYHVRRLVATCAGRVPDDGGGSILAALLADSNINVRLAAAQTVAEHGHPSAKAAILKHLSKTSDEEVREFLALAAGYLPGEDTIQALRPLSRSDSRLGGLARSALVRLGDASAKAELVAALSASSPRKRYEALEFIQKTGDRTLAPAIARLLSDRADAVRIGIVRNPRYRRVCDQATDTAVSLLGLRLSFSTGPEKIYSPQELREVLQAVGG